MNISSIFQEKKAVFSLEIFPPKKTSPIETIYNTLADLKHIPADFISVTYGAGGTDTQKNKTAQIAALIKKEYNIEPVAHLTCLTSSTDDIVAILKNLKENDVKNILALRGDRNPDLPEKNDFKYASDLTKFIKEYDPSFNVSGACYPECHCECDDINNDIENLKIKIDAGATHLVSQLFFNNDNFYEFLNLTQKHNINIPISAGIMPVVNKAQIERTVSMCGASLPVKFSKIVNKYAHDPIALRDAGIYYATEQIIDLLSNDVHGIHLYTMNNVYIATQISNSIKSIVESNNSTLHTK